MPKSHRLRPENRQFQERVESVLSLSDNASGTEFRRKSPTKYKNRRCRHTAEHNRDQRRIASLISFDGFQQSFIRKLIGKITPAQICLIGFRFVCSAFFQPAAFFARQLRQQRLSRLFPRSNLRVREHR